MLLRLVAATAVTLTINVVYADDSKIAPSTQPSQHSGQTLADKSMKRAEIKQEIKQYHEEKKALHAKHKQEREEMRKSHIQERKEMHEKLSPEAKKHVTAQRERGDGKHAKGQMQRNEYDRQDGRTHEHRAEHHNGHKPGHMESDRRN